MQYLNVDYQNLNINDEICLTIGNFDGIHKGHNKILEKLKLEASSLNIKSAILSFDPHPNFYFNDIQRFLINTKQKKIHILEEKKIDYLSPNSRPPTHSDQDGWEGSTQKCADPETAKD